MAYFTDTGKAIIGFSPRTVDINKLYVLNGCTEKYAVPEAYTDVTGFSVASDFYGGIFDKVGIEPQVQRIGQYKSFGDTFSRTSMSDAQKEVVNSLLDSVSGHKLDQLARDSGSTRESIEALLMQSSAVIKAEDLVEGNLLTGNNVM